MESEMKNAELIAYYAKAEIRLEMVLLWETRNKIRFIISNFFLLLQGRETDLVEKLW